MTGGRAVETGVMGVGGGVLTDKVTISCFHSQAWETSIKIEKTEYVSQMCLSVKFNLVLHFVFL